MEAVDKKIFYERLYKAGTLSLLDYFDNLSYDELIDIDLENNTFKQLFHIEGKYFIAHDIGTFTELIEFAKKYVIHPDDIKIYEDNLKPKGFFDRLLYETIPNFKSFTVRYKLKNGDYRYAENVILTGEEYDIKPNHFRLYIIDVNNVVNRKFGKIAPVNNVDYDSRDSLTGLLSERDFVTKVNSFLSSEFVERWCLISLDIEHFSFFTEWFGKEKSEYLLSKIGDIITEYELNNEGFSAFLGHDDFAIFVKYDMVKIRGLYKQIKELIISFGLSFGFLPIFGIAIAEKDLNFADLFDRASIALKKSKRDIKNRISVYNNEVKYKLEEEYRFLSEFMNAFRNGEITFNLQPQCRISTRCIVGAEALARWRKKDGSYVSPALFVPLLEKYGFIIDMDQYIWEKVCQTIRKWLDEGLEPVPISVNVSREDIFIIDIHKYFVDLTAKYNIPHSLIKIEITESAYAETTEIIEKLTNDLQNDGFLVLMDDFGSGYSSLNMLNKLKVDVIKLDAKFLHIKQTDYTKGAYILESVINMAKQIGLPIIVEGVESKSQCDFLESLGCRYVQGYYFYKAIPISEFEKLIKNKKNIDNRGFVVKLNEQFRIREFLDKNVYSDAMLNNIIGPVAIYSWHEDHVDIVRFNEQFYQAVNVPDFHERLLNIEMFVPNEDRPKFFAALKEAKENKLTGASEVIRFGRIDGTNSYFSIHFYHLGTDEFGERYYGSATNVTELMQYIEERRLLQQHIKEDVIFVNKVYEKRTYTVYSSGLADFLGLTAEEFETKLNNREIEKYFVTKHEVKELIKYLDSNFDQLKDFEVEINLKGANKTVKKFKFSYIYLTKPNINLTYLLRIEPSE